MKFSVGEFVFDTKKRAKEAIQQILHSYPDNTVLAGADDALLRGLVGLHPRAEEKIGCGISHFLVRRIEYGAPGFVIVRTDGTIIDFSYLKALSGKDTDHRQQVIKAMRRAVDDQVSEFRRDTFAQHYREHHEQIAARARIRRETLGDKYDPWDPDNFIAKPEDEYCGPICPLTGVPLTNDKTTHVDHYEPRFVELAEMYASMQVGRFDGILLACNGIQPFAQLAAPHFEQFQQFHALKAQLRLIHGSANLMRERRPTDKQ